MEAKRRPSLEHISTSGNPDSRPENSQQPPKTPQHAPPQTPQQKQQQVVDSAVLDNIHAHSATSPSLTTFSLGSPPSSKEAPAVSAPEVGLNRIYTLVRGVVDGVTGKDTTASNGKDKDKDVTSTATNPEEAGSLASSTYSFPNYSTSSSRITSPTARTNPANAPSSTDPPSPVARRIAQAANAIGMDGSEADPVMQRKPSAGRVRGPSLDIFAPLAATSTVLGTATVGLTTLESTLPSAIEPNPPMRLEMPEEVNLGGQEEILSPTSEVAGGAGVFVEAENAKSPNVLSEDDKFYEDLDDDGGSEILTDEEEAVAGKGGYLGKVAGMKKTIGAEADDEDSEATPKARVRRQVSAAASAVQSPVVPSFAEAIVQATIPASIVAKVATPGASPLLSRTHSIPTSPHLALTSPAIPLDSPTKGGYFQQQRNPAPASSNASAALHNELLSHGVGFGRSAANRKAVDSEAQVDAALRQLRRGELTRDFWMKDENFKECHICSRPFNTWRRKHHCRLCGYVFCSKCTTHINSARFGYSGTMRVCNSCLEIVKDYRSESSDSDGGPVNNSSSGRDGYLSGAERKGAGRAFPMPKDHRPTATPLMAIPATRTKLPTGGDRRSAVIAFDNDLPSPSRPSSARSNRPISGIRHNLPHGHHHHHRGHQHSRSGRWSNIFTAAPIPAEEPAPFQKRPEEAPIGPFKKDSIIDPELAPYMSDEDADGEPHHVGIFATIAPTIQPANIAANVRDVMEADDEADPRPSPTPMQRIPNRSKSPVRPVGSPENSPMRPSNWVKRDPNLRGTISSRSPRKPRNRPVDSMSSPSPSPSSAGGINSKVSPSRSASMRGPLVPVVELNSASLSHVKRLLRQLLRSARVENASAWESALVPILLKCTDDLNPDVRGGDAIDLRHFCKVKRIPGGKPSDTNYVRGLVFSKNLALKGMPRQIMRPRIAVLAFPIEYHKQQTSFMSLEPVIAQEKEYLKNTVNRIIGLQPTLLLVERNVSGLALEHLYAAGIATAVSVKPSVIEAVARCAQADIIFSAEETALKSHRVGRCDSFEVKTYVHPDIPTRNNRKSFMYLSGCQKELGSTIVLRGDKMDTLAKLKHITEFMIYVVYNLKLETCLMRDQFASIPDKFQVGSLEIKEAKDRPSVSAKPSENDAQRVDNTESATTTTADSEKVEFDEKASMTSTIPPSLVPPSLNMDEYPEDLPPPNYYGAYIKEHESTILSASPFVKFAQPYQLVRARNYERRLEWVKRLLDEDLRWEENERKREEERKDSEKKEDEEPFQVITPEMLHAPAASDNKKFRELMKAVHEVEYEKALHAYQSQKKSWELYLSQNDHLFDPMEHQEITTLYSMISSQTSVPCRGPEMIMFEFYNDNYPPDDEFKDKDYYREPDCTLGQYIEDLVRTKNYMCESGCEKRMIDHHRSYVHGEARVSVHVQEFKCQLRNMQNQILMWSYCKLCKNQQSTPVMPMSETTWKYSFGKYLELSFWSQPIGMRTEDCPHDLHRDHVRYFGFHDYAVRFEYDSIDLMEVFTPRSRVTWKPELDTDMKNRIYNIMHDRINKFWDSVVLRLKNINVESVAAEKLDDCKQEISALLVKAEEERRWVINKLQDKYTNSKYFEVLPLNRAMRAMQERVVDWDQDFADFDLNYFPSEKDIRRMAAWQLRKMFLDRDSSTSSLPPDTDVSTIGETSTIGDSSSIGDKDTSEFPSEDHLPVTQTPSIDESNSILSSVADEGTGKSLASAVDTPAAVSDISLPAPSTVSELNTASEPAITPLYSNTEASESMEHSIVSTLPESASEPNLDSSAELTPSTEKLAVPPMLQESGSASNPELGTVYRKDFEPAATAAATSTTPTTSSQQPISPVKDIIGEPTKLSAAAKNRLPNLKSNLPTRKSMMPAGLARNNSSPSTIPKSAEAAAGSSTTSRSEKRSSIGSKLAKDAKAAEKSKSVDKGKKPDGKSKFERQVNKALREFKPDKAKLREGLRQVLGGKKGSSASQIPVPRSQPGKGGVSSLAKHFEQLSREFEKERERKTNRPFRRTRPVPVASSKPIVEVYRNVEQAVQAMSDDEKEDEVIKPPELAEDKPVSPEPSTSEDVVKETPPIEAPISPPGEPESSELTAEEPQTQQGNATEGEGDASDTEFSLLSDNDSVKIPPEVAEVLSPDNEISSELKLEADLPKHERTSLMKILSNFWSERSASGWAPLEYPLSPSDHVFADSDVIVREDEPSSLIAFALNCNDYSSKLHGMRTSVIDSIRDTPLEDFGTFSDEGNLEAQATKMSLLSEKGTHLKYQFQEGSAKMFCKIFFAEQFDALRRRCGVAERYVESLSRCIKWDSKGGKTRSVFLKTLDDRIVLKQLSPVETTAFLKFAPSYFHIMSEALFRELPTAIAKMLGFYQIFIKNSLTGAEIKWDILVMENLFYDRKMTRIFDLKGSMRNRYTQETGEQNEVLLDENMVEFIFENPLFIREASKKLLRVSLWNDTLFLERNQVMDYSLMIGIDEERKELVVGLIDCVRTYTFDKRLENLIKASGIAGGGRNRPTITSPKEYKRRFREAMERYILEAPNCWRQSSARLTWIKSVGIPLARGQIEQAGRSQE